MPPSAEFEGFPSSALKFFADLKMNNNREWFTENKPIYLNDVVEPAKAFIFSLGSMLQEMHPGVNFDTRTNGSGSMFRIYRDVRFSKDKTPYKTYLGMIFWVGSGKKKDSPGFYVGVGSEGAGVYAGMWGFPKENLAAYRKALDDPDKADDLGAILDGLRADGYDVGGEHYKRVPRGFDPDHPHAELLKYNAVHAGKPKIDEATVTSPDFVPVAFEHCVKYWPMVDWLHKNT